MRNIASTLNKPVIETMEELGTALPDGAVLLVLVRTVDAVPDPVAGQVVGDAGGAPVLKEGLGAGKVLGTRLPDGKF